MTTALTRKAESKEMQEGPESSPLRGGGCRKDRLSHDDEGSDGEEGGGKIGAVECSPGTLKAEDQPLIPDRRGLNDPLGHEGSQRPLHPLEAGMEGEPPVEEGKDEKLQVDRLRRMLVGGKKEGKEPPEEEKGYERRR